MNKILLFTVLLWTASCAVVGLQSCHKDSPTTCDRITGVWGTTFGPDNFYHFSDGLLSRYTVDFGTIVYTNQFAYSCEGDALHLVDIVDGSEHDWTVEFTGEDEMVIKTVGLVNINLVRYP